MFRATVVAALVLCGKVTAAPGGQEKGAMHMQPIRVKETGPGTFLITAESSLDGESGEGQVVVRSRTAPRPAAAPHAALAEGRAFLALGEKLAARKRLPSAIEAAQGGLAALGQDYAPPGVDDDTTLKLAAAEDQIEKGNLGNGATTLLRVLRERIDLYVKAHQAAIVR